MVNDLRRNHLGIASQAKVSYVSNTRHTCQVRLKCNHPQEKSLKKDQADTPYLRKDSCNQKMILKVLQVVLQEMAVNGV